jgi:hypothetical protein
MNIVLSLVERLGFFIRKKFLLILFVILGIGALCLTPVVNRYLFELNLPNSYNIALMYARGHKKMAAMRNYDALCESLGEAPTDPKRVAELVDFLADGH